MVLKKVDIKDLKFNPMTMINDEWMLITAKKENGEFNTMTASWGHLGSLWGKMTATIYIRPQRYTKEFVDDSQYFTLSFFAPGSKKDLAYLGKASGRDEDKIAKTALTPVIGDDTVYFQEARLVFICKKMYCAPIKEDGFMDGEIVDTYYPHKDFHDMYVGEIMEVLVDER